MTKTALRQDKPQPMQQDPNKSQRTASDPATSAWVRASAGSGKTKVLADRVTRLLLAGVLPQRILCLTFTKAAAAEMSIRITQQLSQWATGSDDALRQSLDNIQGHVPTVEQLRDARRLFARVLACPGGMRIRTIHAFCQEILRRFPIEAGLPPHFNVIEEGDAHALQTDVQMDLLQAASAEPSSEIGQALRFLVNDFGEHGFAEAMHGLLNDRARLLSAKTKAVSLERLIAAMRSLVQEGAEETVATLRAAAVDDGHLPRAEISQVAKQLLQGTKSYAERGQKILNWLDLPITERAEDFDTYCRAFFTAEGKPYEKFANKDLQLKFPEMEVILRREAGRLQNIIERLERAALAQSTAATLVLGEELLHRYAARKSAQAALDYDDLIIRTDELLQRPGIAPWILYKLDDGLDHILVDEAQDTNSAQWNIIEILAEEFFSGNGARTDVNRTLFVVGDEKQSIFSFRHAAPAAFTEKGHHFSRRITEAGKLYLDVPLHTSFRSAPAILQAVDQVFANPRAQAGVSTDVVKHFPFHRDRVGRVEVWPLLPVPEKDKSVEDTWQLPLGYEQERDPEADLAEMIALRIRNWITHKEILQSYNRPIEAGDVMILMRRRGIFAGLMVRALKKHGVAVTGVDRMKLAQQLPVMDLLALMQFTLLPEDDLNLATVLRGPLLGLDEAQLMKLAIGREGSLWLSLTRDPSYAAAHDYLARWLAAADYMTPFTMLAHILNEPCPASQISGRNAIWGRLGPDALDPIEELLNAAQEFSHRHTPSLQAFVHWLMITDAEIKREMDRSGGQVRIMTVHAAKGLEAPIVFLPDAASVPRTKDMPKWLWDTALGIPIYVPRKPQTGIARRLWDEARQKQLEEYRRLLYVALTRAIDRLYICGWESARDENGQEESWYSLTASALQSLHRPSDVGREEPQPMIAFADPDRTVDEVKTKFEGGLAMTTELPDWINRPAPAEPTPPRPLAPSRASETEQIIAVPNARFTRGLIMHRLLQSLPDVEVAKRDDVAARFLANAQHRLTLQQQAQIKQETLALLENPDYAPLFAADSRAEVPIIGHIGDRMIAGQIDRLCVRQDEVWIIDYKSNRPPPQKLSEVSLAYLQQMAAYRAVLKEIYPGKAIHCFLLWTYGPKLMAIPEELPDSA